MESVRWSTSPSWSDRLAHVPKPEKVAALIRSHGHDAAIERWGQTTVLSAIRRLDVPAFVTKNGLSKAIAVFGRERVERALKSESAP